VRITLLCGALLLSSAALPAQDIKPFDVKLGLWETTSTTEMSGMAMPNMPQIPPDALSRMPPEQRARVEAMMKGRGGAARPVTTKVCITKETLAHAGAFGQTDKSCTMTVVSSTPSKQVMHMDCTRQENHMSGDMTVERVDTEHAKGSMVMKSEGEHAVNMKMSFENKWLGADCGDVKPVLPK
jgi:Protein of unknown function (DUF3617)